MTVLDGIGPEALMGCQQSDEFMLYQFKVLPCTRKGAHSWTECPFTHQGEKAARRCPRSYIYSAEACPDARKSGKCARGDLCPYSHGVFEQWLHPSRYRTQLCSFGTACRRPVCFFAHTVQELRVPTACGPTTSGGAAAAPAAAAALAGLPGARPPAAAGLDAAALAGAAAAGKDGAYMALLQQAMLAQMSSQAAAMQQLDGATATMINRYQAASCAALANAAACQRQQQQHQAAAAAAAAAAIAAAANNPASLLHMAQAAQAYQAAAAAAAAAAANVPMPQQHALGAPSSGQSSSSNVSSPTCSSHNASSLASASTYGGAADGAGSELSSRSGGSGGLYDSLFLQQALAQGGCGGWPGSGGPFSPAPGHAAAPGLPPGSSCMPWLPPAASSPACELGRDGPGGAFPGCGGAFPGGALMPGTPGIADACYGQGYGAPSCGLDALASRLVLCIACALLLRLLVALSPYSAPVSGGVTGMEDVTRELQHRRRILGIYTKTRGDFESKSDFDNYLEAVEDIIYKLSNNVDVAEVEQQVQDYIRQEAATAGASAAPAAAAYVPPSAGNVLQPAPLVQVQQDAEGRLLPVNPGTLGREQWWQMAAASGWTQALATQRALQDAFTAIFAF
ncbi:zinc finger CCCH domain-containing protein 2 [Scenedesmus sp. PABB004]|nr:zinc finger CCCH domain-containing protein 2 [Scenedesmus sp. PABB004]